MTGVGFVQKLLKRPRSLLLWKLNFQVHLWLGILLTLYLLVIGVTGSILVFRIELERLSGARPWPVSEMPKPLIAMQQVISSVRSAYPASHLIAVATPTLDEPFFVAMVQGRGQRNKVRVDPRSGTVIAVVKTKRSWVDFVADLHTTFLAGRSGRIVNGLGAALLLVINLTGLAIWWPGVKFWKRSLTVDLRRSWRRINYDLHRAVGFWALAMLSMWAISGIYFAWPTQVFRLVDRFSPVISAQPPVVIARPVFSTDKPDLSHMIAKAAALDPDTKLAGINFPYSRRAPFEILMRRGNGIGREYTDIVYFSPWDGTHLKTWRYGVNESLGDWLIWLQVPLHFGTYWGLGVKILWAALGVTLPLLAITGALLYWNRILRHRKFRRPEARQS